MLTLQIHHTGNWHTAATVEIQNTEEGTASPATVDYIMDYVADWDSQGLRTENPAHDFRALSFKYPTDFVPRRTESWPPFLLDVLPQGAMRRRIAARLGFANPDDPTVEYQLLLRGGGCPIGNIRIEEAWQLELDRLRDEPFRGLSTDEVLGQSDRFVDVVDRFALIASGSTGVQGDWPKVLLTRANDRLWYPDPLVSDENARTHIIVKLLRDREPEYAKILAAEAPYLEVARAFGLRAAKGLKYASGVLMIPRFDREVNDTGVVRHGQESLVSALGIAEFGYVGHHEDFLDVVKNFTSEPHEEVIEYVHRDLLNFAMGNPDNHGRNTAIQKRADGWIGLTPLFDFAPMQLDPVIVPRSTRWHCLKGGDGDPDWSVICDSAAKGVMDPAELRASLAAKASFLRALPETARKCGVADETIKRACVRHEDAARGVEKLA